MSGFAGVALGDMDRHFAWQAWHLWHWVGSGGALGSQAALGRRGVLRGRRGTLWHPPSLCVAGVALDDMDRHFAWPAWHLSTHRSSSSLCVAGVALMALGWLWWRAWFPGRAGTPRRFAWQAWHFVTSTFTLCGRRGTWWHGSSLCVAGVALVNTWIVTLRGLRGRRGTYGTGLALVARLVPRPRWDAAAFCVAGVALCDIHLHFVWQAWHLMTWIVTLRGRRGRRGTCQHMDRHFASQAWHLWHWVGSGGALGSQAALGRRGVLRGRRGTLWHPPSLCVAGVALDDMDRHFAWQAWHLQAWHLQAWHLSTHGSSLCVAGVALMALGWLWWRAWFPGRAGTPRRFAWQAWHFVTSTFTLCGRRGTWWHGRRGALWHPPSLCVAGVALDDMDRHFAWQAWHLWHWVGSGGALGSRPSIHPYIHTYTYIHIHTYIYIHIHTYTYIYIHIHTYTYIYIHIHTYTYIHTYYMHTQLTHTGLYVDVIAKELALSEATWCYWITVFSIVCLAGLLFGCNSFTWLHTPTLHHLFSLSCFPHAIFTFLLLLVGRSWHVGLSGSFIIIFIYLFSLLLLYFIISIFFTIL